MSLRRIAELEAERKYCRGGKRLQEYLQRCHSVIDDFVGEQTRAAPGARAPTKDVCAAAHLVKKSKVVHYGFTHYLNQFAAERCRRIDSVQDIASLASLAYVLQPILTVQYLPRRRTGSSSG
ncbi:hypothetical protein DIPPA_06093 [Diplonema papillatum]|nr:hypothetical protein DIPPA_06093 [Diplonema papillatum]